MRNTACPIRRRSAVSSAARSREHVAAWSSSLQIGKPASAFELVAVADVGFRLVGPDDFRGKWLVLLFYPLDFTFIRPTDLCMFSGRIGDLPDLPPSDAPGGVRRYHNRAWPL